jgi:hypothetical protein
MELWEIVRQTATPLGKNPFEIITDAESQALNTNAQRTQNAVSALNLGREQALQGIAPQIGQAFADSGMPMGNVLGQMVSADPRLASMGFREAMDYEQDRLKRQMLSDPRAQAILADIDDDYQTLAQIQRDVTKELDPKKLVQMADLYQMAEREIYRAKGALGQIGWSSALIEGSLPKPMPYMNVFKDILGAQQSIKQGQRADKTLQQGERRLSLDQKRYDLELQKIDKEDKSRMDDRIWKALDKNNLMSSDAYNTSVNLIRTAVEKDSPFALAKLLSQVIEPGLSVTEGEAGNYVVGGEGAFAKWMNEKVGTSGESLKELENLAVEFIRLKQSQAKAIEDKKGDVFNTRQGENKPKDKKSIKQIKRF